MRLILSVRWKTLFSVTIHNKYEVLCKMVRWGVQAATIQHTTPTAEDIISYFLGQPIIPFD